MNQCEHNHPRRDLSIDIIYAEYDGFIRSVINYAAKHHADREDVYQEVFVTLSQKEDFSGIENIKGYLYRLITNKIHELGRKRVAANLRLQKYAQIKASVENEASCEEDLMVSEEVDKTVKFIKEYLSEKESQAVLLRYRDHLDNDEAAEKMNIQKKTLIRYVSVGLKKIRDIIKSQQESE